MSDIKTLLDQLSDAERACVATLYGAQDDATFQCILADTPALPKGWTLGDAARAALRQRLAYLEGMVKG